MTDSMKGPATKEYEAALADQQSPTGKKRHPNVIEHLRQKALAEQNPPKGE